MSQLDCRYLNIENNVISGTFPTTLTTMTALTELWMCCNYINGTIPSTISTLTNLRVLRLNSQAGWADIQGTIPSIISSLVSLR